MKLIKLFIDNLAIVQLANFIIQDPDPLITPLGYEYLNKIENNETL